MKDARGHGSNGRSGSMRGGIASMKRTPYAKTQERAAAAAESLRMGGHGSDSITGGSDVWSSTPGGDREAASTLSSGGSKSTPVPVHDSMGGGDAWSSAPGGDRGFSAEARGGDPGTKSATERLANATSNVDWGMGQFPAGRR